MISHLKFHNIGPDPELEVASFGRRLNLITGDNGLGKTFLLDGCWYALTRTWADDKPFYPLPDVAKDPVPSLTYSIVGKTGKEVENIAEYQFRGQTWKSRRGRPPMPGLVVYARIDGGFSIWDPARNYWRDDDDGDVSPDRPAAYQFSKAQVWDGLDDGEGDRKNIICNGLLRDVESWRARSNGSFALLQKVLERLSADERERLSLGEGVRVRLADVRDIPTLKMPYGTVPVTHAAAGMRRVLALAYLLVWAWDEHQRASKLQKEEPTDRVVLLFDEVEAHLHPKWQRVFVPALLDVVNSLLLGGNAQSVQIIATTHSPLVLGSVEASWKADTDRLFDFDLEDGQVEFEEIPFVRHGSAENWLLSDSFDLPSGYPVEAQKAMERADTFMQLYPASTDAPANEKAKIHTDLLAALGGDDEYWPYWLPYYEEERKNGLETDAPWPTQREERAGGAV